VAYDAFAALRVLEHHDVRFVIVGGVAARLWGSPTVTNDFDICHAQDGTNLQRLAAALWELGARLRGVEEDVPLMLDAETLAKGQNFTFATDAGTFDIVGLPAGVRGFEELDANAVPFDLGEGLVVRLCHLDDLIRMKQAAGRAKDRIVVEILTTLRDELLHGPWPGDGQPANRGGTPRQGPDRTDPRA
jgi:hypothetical protein